MFISIINNDNEIEDLYKEIRNEAEYMREKDLITGLILRIHSLENYFSISKEIKKFLDLFHRRKFIELYYHF